MSETVFARQILNTLSPLPINHQPSSTSIPSNNPHGTPVLPKMGKPYILTSDRSRTQSPASKTTIILKPLKGAVVSLEDVDTQTSIYEVKVMTGKKTGYAPDKIKVLWEKRPAGDSKTVAEVIGASGAADETTGGITFGIMFVGQPTWPVDDGSGDVPMTDSGVVGKENPSAVPVQSSSTKAEEILSSADFWKDLGIFVQGRLGDVDVAQKVVDGFRRNHLENQR